MLAFCLRDRVDEQRHNGLVDLANLGLIVHVEDLCDGLNHLIILKRELSSRGLASDFPFLVCELPAQICHHHLLYFFDRVALTQEIGKLSDAALDSHIEREDCAKLNKRATRLVQVVDTSLAALRHDDNDNIIHDRLLHARNELLVITWDVTHPVGLDNDCLAVLQDAFDDLHMDTRHDVDERYIFVHFREHLKLAIIVVSQQSVPVYGKADANFTERTQVRRIECNNLVGAHLGRTVTPQQLVTEEDSNFRNLVLTCQ